MKLLMVTTVALFAFSTYASEIDLRPSDISMKCEKANLAIHIPKVARLTSSGADTFGLNNQNQSICLALKDHLSKIDLIRGIMKTSVRDVDTYIDNPVCDGDSCSVTYKFYKLEMIELSLEGIPFNARKEVAGTSKLRKVHWNRRDCPPFYPDCDL